MAKPKSLSAVNSMMARSEGTSREQPLTIPNLDTTVIPAKERHPGG